MKKLGLMVLLLAFCATPAIAGPIQVGDIVTWSNGAGTTSGGEFILTYQSGPVVNGAFVPFITFCLELNEFLGQPMKVGAISTAADAGGVGGPSPDPLDYVSAKIYANYYSNYGGLTTGWSANRKADAVQKAIWCKEQEGASYCNDGDAGALITWAGSPTSIGSIRVLNLLKQDATGRWVNAQDLIVDTNPVPEPASMFLFGSGLVGLAGMARRRFKK